MQWLTAKSRLWMWNCLQPFNNGMDGAKEDLLDMFIVHSTAEIQARFSFLRWIKLFTHVSIVKANDSVIGWVNLLGSKRP